ncbi:MAG: helix-turn-helix domain-containing protein [Terriglobia bacterium]
MSTDQAVRFYKVSDAATLLGVKENTLRKWILLRKIGYAKIHGAVRIPLAELEKIVNYVPARPEAQG